MGGTLNFSLARAAIGRTVSIGSRALSLKAGAETAISLYQARAALFNVGNHIGSGGFSEALKQDEGFAKVPYYYEDVLAVLGSNLNYVFDDVVTDPDFKNFLRNDKNHLLVYGPTPDSKTPWIGSTRVPIGNLSSGKKKRKILLELGRSSGKGDRAIGLGNTHGNGVGHDQWFRMDWHTPHGKESWIDGDFHFHTLKDI